jgi:hypothetical protein
MNIHITELEKAIVGLVYDLYGMAKERKII